MKIMRGMGLVLWIAAQSFAEMTPMNAEIPEETLTKIACEYKKPLLTKDLPFLRGREERLGILGSYVYSLWLPKGYHEDPKRTWPVLFIVSPDSEAKLGNMEPWIRKNEYVAVIWTESASQLASKGIGNFMAAHDDAAQRLRLKPDSKIITGFTFCAANASRYALLRPGFRGIILQAGAPMRNQHGVFEIQENREIRRLRVATVRGFRDDHPQNSSSVYMLTRTGHQVEFFPFDGGRDWAPAEIFAKAADWVIQP
ncbi:MAG: hypothetical protein U1E27_00510 [Kiritimatiellia bacterium]|nr:hypothetical protein [Kiritimatiellia bacterium]